MPNACEKHFDERRFPNPRFPGDKDKLTLTAHGLR
jgi:hypothetical protein